MEVLNLQLVQLTSADEAYIQQCSDLFASMPEAGSNKAEADACILCALHTGTTLPQTFAAVSNGKAVGMYQIARMDGGAEGKKVYAVNLIVDKAYRGRGIARFLFESVPEAAKKAGCRELYLYTLLEDFYEKFGWTRIGLQRVPYKKNATEVCYRKIISD